MGAVFLVRFDDICPTMNWDVWRSVEDILIDSEVKPILAVVPDNHDAHLKVMPANPEFWDEVRRWQALGWTIALHGYQHLAITSEPGIIGLDGKSEFAGLPYDEQLARLTEGVAVFRREGVVPEVWIAPSHSFDCNTLDALRSLGIRRVSDGMSIYPYTDRGGMLWVPQQLWRFYAMPAGVWTVCCHHNPWKSCDLEKFRRNIARYGRSITSFGEVANRYERRRLSAADAVAIKLLPGCIRARCTKRVPRKGMR